MPEPGSPVGVEPEPERLADRRAHVLREGHLRPLGELGREHAEAFVRVDPAPLGRRDRLRALEGQAGGVGQQVADGRSRRAGRLVQIDDSFLGGHEHRQRGDRLRDGGKADRAPRVAMGLHAPAAEDDPGGRERDRPLVDLAKGLHARRY